MSIGASLPSAPTKDFSLVSRSAAALFAVVPEPKALAITPGCDHRYSAPEHLAALLDRSVEWIVAHLPLAGSPS